MVEKLGEKSKHYLIKIVEKSSTHTLYKKYVGAYRKLPIKPPGAYLQFRFLGWGLIRNWGLIRDWGLINSASKTTKKENEPTN